MEALDAELKSEPERRTSQSDDEGERLADLGVLLVHGIGQSRSSETLSRFGEPLVSWITDWVGEFATAEVEVTDALLGFEAEGPETPAHARLKVSAPAADGSGNKSADWLIAESWWAESFQPPTFGEIATWAIKVVPWTAFYHFNRRRRRALARLAVASQEQPRQWRTLLTGTLAIGVELLAVIAALLVSPVVVLALLIILLLGLIPIPQLRRLVAAVQRGLASTIGDSYALLGPNISSAGIYGRVARQLAWLEKRSRKVAVVAHSQGAAIAYRIVSTRASQKCGLLVTFGAGIRKLVHIRLLARIAGGWGWAPAMAVVSFVVATLISRETIGLWHGLLLAGIIPLSWFAAGFIIGLLVTVIGKLVRKLPQKATEASDKYMIFIGFGIIIGTIAAIVLWYPAGPWTMTTTVSLLLSAGWGWVFFANQRAGEDAKNLGFKETTRSGRPTPATEQPLPSQVRWLDFYAVSDPVPNGPIFDGQQEDPVDLRAEADQMESIPVHNRDSLFLDHTTYWQNSEDFVAEVAGALGRLSELELSNVIPLDRERRIVARHRRRWRVRWLRRARWLVVLMAGAVWVWSDLDSATEWLLGQLVALVTSLPWLGTFLESILPGETTATTTTRLMVLAGGAAAAYGAVTASWLHWESLDRETLVSRRGYPKVKERYYHTLWFHFAWVLILTIGVLLACGWTQWPWWTYLSLLAIQFFVAAGIAGGVDTFGYPGDVVGSWPELLRKLGAWDEDVRQDWLTRLEESTIALIEPVVTQDGTRSWQVSIVLVPRTSQQEQTTIYNHTQVPTLYDAAMWSASRAKTSVVTLGDQEFVPVREVLTRSEDLDMAWQFWTDLIEGTGFSETQLAEALIMRATYAQLRGDTDQSLVDYTTLLELENAPWSFREKGYLYRAGTLEENGDSDAAMADYTALIEATDTSAENRSTAYLQRGALRQHSGQIHEANADFTTLVDSTDSPPETVAQARAARGWGYYLDGDIERFIADSQEALVLSPDQAWVGFNLALGHLLNGARDEADTLYDAHCKKAPKSEIEAGIEDLEEALAKHPEIDGLDHNLQRLRTRLAEVAVNVERK